MTRRRNVSLAAFAGLLNQQILQVATGQPAAAPTRSPARATGTRSRSDRARRRGPTPEGALLRTITDALSAMRIPWRRLAAGAFRVGEARRFVRMGSPGLPDLLVWLPHRLGLIEVKSARGRLSEEQVAIRRLCVEHRVPHCVARSLDDVTAWLASWRQP